MVTLVSAIINTTKNIVKCESWRINTFLRAAVEVMRGLESYFPCHKFEHQVFKRSDLWNPERLHHTMPFIFSCLSWQTQSGPNTKRWQRETGGEIKREEEETKRRMLGAEIYVYGVKPFLCCQTTTPEPPEPDERSRDERRRPQKRRRDTKDRKEMSGCFYFLLYGSLSIYCMLFFFMYFHWRSSHKEYQYVSVTAGAKLTFPVTSWKNHIALSSLDLWSHAKVPVEGFMCVCECVKIHDGRRHHSCVFFFF